MASFSERIGVDQVKLGRCVGIGTAAKVYEAQWIGMTVIIKKKRPLEEIEEKGVANRIDDEFIKESEILSSLRHPAIVAYYGWTSAVDRPDIVDGILLEYCSGGVIDLSEAKAAGRLCCFRLATEIASAMAYAHARGIIHRDLKPSNLLLDRKPLSTGHVKVSDWGLSRFYVSKDGDSQRMTGETGTYQWMSPEVITCSPYNEKCDVYSYGILMWNLITGNSHPYPFLTPTQCAVGVVKSDLRPDLSSLTDDRDTTTALPSFLRQCWNRDPSKRPSFQEALVMLGSMAEIESKKVGTSTPSWSFLGWS